VPSPILEEEPRVETSLPLENLEVTSPNQHPGTPAEELEEDRSREGDDQDNIEDSSLDDQVDQYIMAPNEQHFESGHQSNLVLPSSKDVPPSSNILASSAAMSQEELEQFEKDNPFDAFKLLLRSDTLLSKSIGKSSDTSIVGLSQNYK